jgi:hypothetical protein
MGRGKLMSYGDSISCETLDEFINQYGHLLAGGHVFDYVSSEQVPEADALASLEAFSAWEGDYAEEDVQALLRLKDGRYATVVASCDSTGYDCQGYVDWHIAETFEEAVLFGLDESARKNLFPQEDDSES